MAQRIKRDDNVLVIKGKSRGKAGAVRQVIPKEQKIIVTGVNIVKRHMRPQFQRPGGIIEREAPLPWANVKLLCPACNAAVRVGFRRLDDDRKVRYCKKCDANLD
ncbi:MAG: 50S ribosomal protein L24 [Chloroflexi bacterium]|nr:50S ribosomal protein L24 [Chloroflexota bacterium]